MRENSDPDRAKWYAPADPGLRHCSLSKALGAHICSFMFLWPLQNSHCFNTVNWQRFPLRTPCSQFVQSSRCAEGDGLIFQPHFSRQNMFLWGKFQRDLLKYVVYSIRGGAVIRGLLVAGPPPPPLGGCEWQDEQNLLGGGPSDGINTLWVRRWAAVNFHVNLLATNSSLIALRGTELH